MKASVDSCWLVLLRKRFRKFRAVFEKLDYFGKLAFCMANSLVTAPKLVPERYVRDT